MENSGDTMSGLFIVGGKVKAILEDSGQQIVREHLSTLLQVQNLVVLIGSGASFHLGSPNTRGLKNEKIEEMIRKAGQSVDEGDSQLLNSLNSQDDGNLEQLLNALQLAIDLAKHAGHQEIPLGEEDDISVFRVKHVEELRKKIGAALVEACKLPGDSQLIDEDFQEDPLRAHRSFISQIVRNRRPNLARPKLFTTNYDLVIEKALDELGFPYIDGFSGTVDRRLNLAYYGLDFHRLETSSQKVLNRAENSLYLHKIHGSLNWVPISELDKTTKVMLQGVKQITETSSGSADRVLIYPTTAKEGDTLAYPYSDLMRLLGDSVQQEDTAIISVGYGFSDAHINRILLQSLALNPALHLLVADPFAVLNNEDMAIVGNSEGIVGKRLAEIGVTPRETAVGSLSESSDSRIAVLTGEAGMFTKLAGLFPDPSREVGQVSPTVIADLIASLGAVYTPSDTNLTSNGAGDND